MTGIVSNLNTFGFIRNIIYNKHIDMNPNGNRDTISKLKFISKLKKGEKFNTRFVYVQPDGLITKISRTFYNIDNRGNALTFIQSTVHRSFDIITLYINSENISEKQTAINLLDDLDSCKEGLLNLKNTYIDDTMFGCTIDTLLEEIESRLCEFNEKNYPEKEEIK